MPEFMRDEIANMRGNITTLRQRWPELLLFFARTLAGVASMVAVIALVAWAVGNGDRVLSTFGIG